LNLAATDFSQIPMSQSLAATLARASEAAGSLGAAEVSLEHVLLALCDDPDAEAVLIASRVDLSRLRSEVLGYLGSLKPQSPGGGLAVSPGVSRILEAAAAAARGGRRRDINGAIVLAAIVGDGKSAAAQILQAQGLTFDEAIRALQSALSVPLQRDTVPDMRPADDVLAGARARVQSRSAPSLRDIMSDLPRSALPPPAPIPDVAVPHVPEPLGQSQRPQWSPSFEPEASPAFEQAAPAASEPVAIPAPAPDMASEAPKADSGYVYPAIQPALAAPPAAAQPSPEHPVSFDLPRPSPIATPPPIPPPIPQQGGGFGAPASYPPQPYAPMQTPLPQMQLPRWDGSTPGRPGAQQSEQQGGFSPTHQNAGNSYGQLNRQPGPPPPMRAPVPMAGAPAPQQQRQAKPKSEAGQLAENIPRGMRVGKTERVEVRIAKASAKAITEGLEGGGVAWQHDVTITQAMSVRLRAPDGGFFIETVSPETQWIENHLGFASDDFASWRFLVTPQSRGWSKLQIVVSARTIGADGMAAETALPDQVVEVKVRTNYKRTFMRLLGWTIAAVAGGAVAKFGENGLDIAQGVVQKFIH
jgi:neural Wiskott-Aldrich syndrome protein